MRDFRHLYCIFALVAFWASSIEGGEPNIASVRLGVIQVRTYDGGSLIGHGSGFFISDDGKIVTNFHVVEVAVANGYELRAMLMETTKQEVLLQPWKCWPDYDIAVLSPLKKLANQPTILKVSATGTVQGEHVWTLGYPLSPDVASSLTSGVVSAIRTTQELESLGDIGKHLNAAAEWVQIDAALNGGNSGGPLINQAGEVVGVNTLKQSSAENMNFSVHSKSLARLLQDLPATPVGYEGVALISPSTVGSSRERNKVGSAPNFPVLELPPIRTPQDAKPQELFPASRALSDAIYRACPACKGAGVVEIRGKEATSDRGLSRTRTVITRKECDACQGHGYRQGKPEMQERCAAKVIDLLCRLEPETKANIRTRSDAISASLIALQRDLAFDGVIQKAGLRSMNRAQIAEPEPVFGYGYVVAQSRGGAKRYVLKVHGYDLHVILDRPIEDSRRDKWWSVIFAGMLTSAVETPEGRVLVVQRGFIRPCAEVYEDAVRQARRDLGLDE